MKVVRLQQLGVLILGLVIFEAVTAGGVVKPTIAPPFHEMVASFWATLGSGFVGEHLVASLLRIFASFVLGSIPGMLVAVVFWKVPLLGKSLEPIVASLYAVPWMFLYPILLLMLGIGSRPIVFLGALFAFVPVVLNLFIGLSEIKPVLLRVGRSNACSVFQIYAKIIFPAAAPYLVSGLKLALLYSFTTVIALEFLLAPGGLGFTVKFTYEFFKLTEMYGNLLFVVLLAFVFTFALNLLESRLRGRYQ